MFKYIYRKISKQNAYILCVFISFTFVMADFLKYKEKRKGNKSKEIIIKLNKLYFSLSFVSSLLVYLTSKLDMFEVPDLLQLGLYVVIFYFAFSRCNEIFFAFIKDATSSLKNPVCKSGLKYYEKINLAMRSYLELIINFGIMYYILNCIGWFSDGTINLLQSIYFSGVTITTLGYGDIHPTTILAQLLTVYEVLSGFTLIVVSFAVYVSCSIKNEEQI